LVGLSLERFDIFLIMMMIYLLFRDSPYSNRATVWTIQEFESLQGQVFLCQNFQIGPGTHPFLYSFCVMDFFLGVKAAGA